MGMIRNTVATVGLAAALAACGSEAAEPPPAPSSSAPSTPSPTASGTPAPPVMPDAAKEHTAEGAKAFVVYYWQVVDYVQRTLDTGPVEAISAPTCAGCQGGIKATKKIRRLGGHVTGGEEEVTKLAAELIAAGYSESVSFTLTNRRQQIKIPGKPTHTNAARTSKMLMTLLPRETGWIAGELRSLK